MGFELVYFLQEGSLAQLRIILPLPRSLLGVIWLTRFIPVEVIAFEVWT